MVSGWQTMTDINCSTKEQFSPNHSGLQSMLVRAVSDCKSSNHIVISATRPYWWWKSSERKLWCLSLLHVYWLHTMGVIHDTGSMLGAGYVYLTWVLAASRSPEPHTHEDAIPHLPVVKELPSLWLVSLCQELASDWLMLDTAEPWIQAVGDNFCIWLRFGRDAKH